LAYARDQALDEVRALVAGLEHVEQDELKLRPFLALGPSRAVDRSGLGELLQVSQPSVALHSDPFNCRKRAGRICWQTVVGFSELHHGRREHQLEGARNFRIQGFT